MPSPPAQPALGQSNQQQTKDAGRAPSRRKKASKQSPTSDSGDALVTRYEGRPCVLAKLILSSEIVVEGVFRNVVASRPSVSRKSAGLIACRSDQRRQAHIFNSFVQAKTLRTVALPLSSTNLSILTRSSAG